MSQNINIHDVVSINRTHIDPSRSYYGGSKLGVVFEIDDKQVGYIDATGEKVHQPLTETDYTVTISHASEIIFEKEIVSQIERRKIEAKAADARLGGTLEWYDTYTRSISFMGKLMRFVRSENYGKTGKTAK